MNNFENNMQKLKDILLQLENDELNLEKQIELFEKSNVLYNDLKTELNSFELKIKEIKNLYANKDDENE